MGVAVQVEELAKRNGAGTAARVDATAGWGLLAGWHLLSLDAPTVAAVWTWFAARVAGVRLPWTDVAAMFAAVWVLYAGDRLMDGRDEAAEGLEARHLFHRRHRRGFAWGIGSACVVLAALLTRMTGAEVRLYLVLGAMLLGWMATVHTVGAKGARRLPKEFVVGVFFAAAVFIPTVAREPGVRAELVWPAVLFGAACGLNCLFIHAWERGESGGLVGWWAAKVRWAGWGLLVMAAGSAVGGGVRVIVVAVGLAAAALLVVDGMRDRFERVSLRALADVALLTPLAVGLCLR